MLKFKYIKMVVDELDSKARWNRHLRLPDTKHKSHLEILPYRFSALSVTVPNHLDCGVSLTGLGFEPTHFWVRLHLSTTLLGPIVDYIAKAYWYDCRHNSAI